MGDKGEREWAGEESETKGQKHLCSTTTECQLHARHRQCQDSVDHSTSGNSQPSAGRGGDEQGMGWVWSGCTPVLGLSSCSDKAPRQSYFERERMYKDYRSSLEFITVGL